MPNAPNREETVIDMPFRFQRKPMAIAAELRPDWKVMTLLMSLQLSSHGGKSSLKRLHVLNWAVRSKRFGEDFTAILNDPSPLFGFAIRFEPAFSRAIDLAVGHGLVTWVGGNRLQISPKGKQAVTVALKDQTLMQQERTFLQTLGKSVTEAIADRVLGTR
jgi:hypothetical protein